MIYVIKNYESINYSKFTILLGVLFLAHRPFLLVFIIYFLYLSKLKINLNNLILGLKGSAYVLLPYLVYRLAILSFGYEIYDGLTKKKWGQFIWIYDFIREKLDMQVTGIVSQFQKILYVIFRTLGNTFLLLLIPILSVLTLFLTKKFNSNIEPIILKSCLFYYFFWSLIGWYPPLRFNLYSLNYLFVLLLLLVIFK